MIAVAAAIPGFTALHPGYMEARSSPGGARSALPERFDQQANGLLNPRSPDEAAAQSGIG